MEDETQNLSGGNRPPDRSRPQYDWWIANRKYFWWALLALGASVIWLDSWLALAGIDFLPGYIRVPNLPESAKAAAVNAAATGVAGFIGLWTFFLTRDQKERHQRANEKIQQELATEQLKNATESNRALLENQRELAVAQLAAAKLQQEQSFELQRELAQKQQQDTREAQAAGLKVQQDMAELQQIESQFVQIAKNFSSMTNLEQVSSAIGLAELAVRPDPRKVAENGKRTGAGLSGFKIAENFPHYTKAAVRLVSALELWDGEDGHRHASDAICRIARWAKDEGTSELLLHELVNLLAISNRNLCQGIRRYIDQYFQAKGKGSDLYMSENLQKSVAELKQLLKLPDHFDLLSPVLLSHPQANLERSRLFYTDGKLDGDQRLFAILRQCNALERNRQLLDYCLSLFSKWSYEDEGELDTKYATRLQEARGLNLFGTYLKGIHLTNRNLHFADLMRADLRDSAGEGVALVGANLFAANLEGSKLSSHSDLSFADLRYANCNRTEISSASLNGVIGRNMSAEGAKFTFVKCKDADFLGSEFSRAYFRNCDFSGAYLNHVSICGSTFESCRFTGTKVANLICLNGPDQFSESPPHFFSANFDDCDFMIYELDGPDDERFETGEEDHHTMDALKLISSGQGST